MVAIPRESIFLAALTPVVDCWPRASSREQPAGIHQLDCGVIKANWSGSCVNTDCAPGLMGKIAAHFRIQHAWSNAAIRRFDYDVVVSLFARGGQTPHFCHYFSLIINPKLKLFYFQILSVSEVELYKIILNTFSYVASLIESSFM